ncbi:MAG: hypothetical protein GY854_30175 [Deltaproteobacteria bacterium]|nr:hypothetical protein [Deltaproteobacteria bacterium]
MAGAVNEIHNDNGVFLIIYTNGGNAQPDFAYNSISQYFEPDYVSGQSPPMSYMYVPWSAVVSLDDMVVQARGPEVQLAQIKSLVKQANN